MDQQTAISLAMAAAKRNGIKLGPLHHATYSQQPTDLGGGWTVLFDPTEDVDPDDTDTRIGIIVTTNGDTYRGGLGGYRKLP